MMKVLLRVYFWIIGLYARCIKLPESVLIHRAGAVDDLVLLVKERNIRSVLLVTDIVLMKLRVPERLLNGLRDHGIDCAVFDGVVPNPTTDNVYAARRIYVENGCEAVIACGGGSVIDCAKMTAVMVKTSRTIISFNRLIPAIRHRALLYAVPTTAGSGSEVTMTAVITDSDRDVKLPINDKMLVPDAAVLDPLLMTGLPAGITAETGMDALTHAVESYIGRWNYSEAMEYSKKAVRLICTNIALACTDGSHLEARSAMALAAYYAGLSFRKASLGYTHAVAHRMSELYGIPHGRANAIILPHVLEYSLSSCRRRLAELARAAGIAGSDVRADESARRFISHIRALNRSLDIPSYIDALEEKDIPEIARRALHEARKYYPVPRIMNMKQMRVFVRSLKPEYTGNRNEPTGLGTDASV
ncbi:MAG: iron-containing alcohol dehydrogenase [Spirochaetota bacterium]